MIWPSHFPTPQLLHGSLFLTPSKLGSGYLSKSMLERKGDVMFSQSTFLSFFMDFQNISSCEPPARVEIYKGKDQGIWMASTCTMPKFIKS